MALRALARVNLAAIERNVAHLRAGLAGGAALCAVVKANASGHGAVPAARAALAGGAAMLAVATAGEAAELRAAGIDAPVLVMGALSAEELPVALARAGRGGGLDRARSWPTLARAAVPAADPGPRQARQRHGPARHARSRARRWPSPSGCWPSRRWRWPGR